MPAQQDSVTEPFNPHGDTTIDGVPIVEGLVMWDYNLRVSEVIADRDADPEYTCPRFCNNDHWYITTGGLFNAGRMWARHPRTRQLASDAKGEFA